MKVRVDRHLRDALVQDFAKALEARINQKGELTFTNPFEGLGVLQIEVRELEDEIHVRRNAGIQAEAMDVAIAAFWMVMSARLTSGED